MAVRAPETEAPSTLITTYLHMTDPSQFQPGFLEDTAGIMIAPMKRADVRFYRFLYDAVGGDWAWRDRLEYSSEKLRAVLEAPETTVYVLYVDAVPAGYVELFKQGCDVEIAYFGLREEFMGRGLGKHLLSFGVARAWDSGAERIWLHTCNLDSPVALRNYQKRGFQVYQVEQEPMPNRYMQ